MLDVPDVMGGLMLNQTKKRIGLHYYDPARRCPKCGGFANTKHERMMGYDMMRLVRRCERCDFFWRELPLDYERDRPESEEPPV